MRGWRLRGHRKFARFSLVMPVTMIIEYEQPDSRRQIAVLTL
jgi:hypothetical protein